MHDLLRDFAKRAQFCVQQHVGLFVKRLARGEQIADFRLWIFVVQQRAMVLMAHAFPDFFRRRPQADDQRVRLEAGKIFRIYRQPAARGDDGSIAAGKFRHGLLLKRAESRFAVRLENVRDGAAPCWSGSPRPCRENRNATNPRRATHGSFARAHETPIERDVDDMPAIIHGHVISGNSRETHVSNWGAQPPRLSFNAPSRRTSEHESKNPFITF